MPKVRLNPPSGVVNNGTIIEMDETGAVDVPEEVAKSLKERGHLDKDTPDKDMKPGEEGQDPQTGTVPERTARK